MSTQCSKHVEEYNKSYYKTRICALILLITKIILRCTVSKTKKKCTLRPTNITLFIFYIIITFFVQLRYIHKESIPTCCTIPLFICRFSCSQVQRCFTLELVLVVTIVVRKLTQQNKHNNSRNHTRQF